MKYFLPHHLIDSLTVTKDMTGYRQYSLDIQTIPLDNDQLDDFQTIDQHDKIAVSYYREMTPFFAQNGTITRWEVQRDYNGLGRAFLHIVIEEDDPVTFSDDIRNIVHDTIDNTYITLGAIESIILCPREGFEFQKPLTNTTTHWRIGNRTSDKYLVIDGSGRKLLGLFSSKENAEWWCRGRTLRKQKHESVGDTKIYEKTDYHMYEEIPIVYKDYGRGRINKAPISIRKTFELDPAYVVEPKKVKRHLDV